MKPIFGLLLPVILIVPLSAQDSTAARQIPLPSSKVLNTPSPGRIGSTNSFPVAIALSPDRQYAALLNHGYGTQQSQAQQSIAILNLKSNEVTDFPDARLAEGAHQSYFLGLAFSSDGTHLYASIGSITDPTGAKPRNTGNGIAVYKFGDGKVTSERFIKIAPQKIGSGKRVAFALRKTAAGTAIPYPAGLAVISGQGSDKLIVANNLSDNAVLIDSADGSISAPVRPQHQPDDPGLVPLHRGCDSRWPSCLVQSVECFDRRRTRSGCWPRDPLDFVIAAEVGDLARFPSDRSSIEP